MKPSREFKMDEKLTVVANAEKQTVTIMTPFDVATYSFDDGRTLARLLTKAADFLEANSYDK